MLMIYGDMFSADTRALLAECRYAGISHEFKVIDTFNRGNMSAEYAEMNPTKSIPMIIDGHSKIMGEARLLHDWIM